MIAYYLDMSTVLLGLQSFLKTHTENSVRKSTFLTRYLPDKFLNLLRIKPLNSMSIQYKVGQKVRFKVNAAFVNGHTPGVLLNSRTYKDEARERTIKTINKIRGEYSVELEATTTYYVSVADIEPYSPNLIIIDEEDDAD